MVGEEETQSQQNQLPEEKEQALAKQETEPSEIEKLQTESDSLATEQLVDVFKDMPPEVRNSFLGFAASFSQVSRPRYNPLFDKFTPEHIHKYLDYVQRDYDHDYELKKTNRYFYLIYAIIALGVFIAGVIYLIPRDRDLLIQLIVILVAIAGGIGGGYGLSKRQSE